jgi:hypothetical protein
VIRRLLILFLFFCWAAPGSALDFSTAETRHFTIRFGEPLPAGTIRETADAFEEAHAAMEKVLGDAGARAIDVVIFAQTGDFTAETGLPVWSAAATIDGAIYMQPVSVLASRGALAGTIRHEVCLVVLLRRCGKDLPPWIAEGLAVYHAGEYDTLRRGLAGMRPAIGGPEDIDALLLDRDDRRSNRWGYVLAYEAVRSMVEGGGAARARKRTVP